MASILALAGLSLGAYGIMSNMIPLDDSEDVDTRDYSARKSVGSDVSDLVSRFARFGPGQPQPIMPSKPSDYVPFSLAFFPAKTDRRQGYQGVNINLRATRAQTANQIGRDPDLGYTRSDIERMRERVTLLSIDQQPMRLDQSRWKPQRGQGGQSFRQLGDPQNK